MFFSGRIFVDKPNLTVLLQHLEAEGRLELDAALAIMIRGRELTAREPNMLEIGTPVIIVGDIHGQFFDMACSFFSLFISIDCEHIHSVENVRKRWRCLLESV